MSTLVFKPSAQALSLGIELEWQLLDPQTGLLTNQAPKLLDLVRKDHRYLAKLLKPEGMRNMIEINTSVHTKASELLDELHRIQDELKKVLRQLPFVIAGGGTHPSEHWGQREVFPKRRYLHLYKVYGFLYKRFSVYGQHIHLGCKSGDEALYLLHALAPYVPHFIALSAASPFYAGINTLFDCSRLTVISAFPTSGTMPFILRWDAFENYFAQLCQFKLVDSMKDLYWDIRPSPNYGTVEIRVCDSPLTFRRAAAIAAYAQALAAYLLDTQPGIDESMYLSYRYNRFAAMRYGLDAEITDVYANKNKSLLQDILNTFKLIRPYAKAFDSEALLDYLEDRCRRKYSDAETLRTVYQKNNDFNEVMQTAIELWNFNL